jgi:hypothetical protein
MPCATARLPIACALAHTYTHTCIIFVPPGTIVILFAVGYCCRLHLARTHTASHRSARRGGGAAAYYTYTYHGGDAAFTCVPLPLGLSVVPCLGDLHWDREYTARIHTNICMYRITCAHVSRINRQNGRHHIVIHTHVYV